MLGNGLIKNTLLEKRITFVIRMAHYFRYWLLCASVLTVVSRSRSVYDIIHRFTLFRLTKSHAVKRENSFLAALRRKYSQDCDLHFSEK